MRDVRWMGRLLAGLGLLQSARSGPAAPADGNPLEGRLLQRSDGNWYVYHAGLKFAVQVADVGDQVIEAIPTASSTQWEALFGAGPTLTPIQPPGLPQPVPGYS